jgi:arabinofuranosyltransferase
VRGRVLALVPAALLLALLLHYHAPHLADDAFIAFRYAEHLAAGAGPVWNPGETPVEGFSSPLWVVLLGDLARVGCPVVPAARVLGVLGALLAVPGVAVLARRLGAGAVATGVAAALAAAVHGLSLWAPSGLETGLVAALATWTAAGLAGGPAAGWVLPAALLGVARPEGPLLVVVAGIAAIFLRSSGRGRTLALASVALLPAVAWLAFRLGFYGVCLPNPYYAKATGPLGPRLADGLGYARWAVPAAALALAGWAARGRPWGAPAAALAVPLAILAAVVAGGGDWMVRHRLLVPVLLPLAGIAAALAAPGPPAPPWRRIAARAAGVLALAALLPHLVPAGLVARAVQGGRLAPEAWQEGTLVPVSLEVAAWIRANAPPGTRVAVDHAGALPWALPGYPAVDMTGLCDIHIAREVPGGLHAKWDPGYVLGSRPGVIVLDTRTAPGTGGAWLTPDYWEGETALVRHPDFARDYRPVDRAWPRIARGGSPAWILLYVRVAP